MESQVLNTLQFDVATATAYTFATRFLRCIDATDIVRHLTYVRAWRRRSRHTDTAPPTLIAAACAFFFECDPLAVVGSI